MSKKWTLYETGDKLVRTRRHCPKCGEGVFLAEHKDRSTCGKCNYTEFKGERKLDTKGEKQETKPKDAGKPKESVQEKPEGKKE